MTTTTDVSTPIQAADHFLLGRRNDTYDLAHLSSLMASIRSAEYFSTHMRRARMFQNKFDLLAHAMSIRPSEGHVMEFGVGSGQTINHIASLTNGKVQGFDVFSGLPEDWRPGYPRGSFSGMPSFLRENVELVAGLFEDTVPAFMQSVASVSLMHVDCDLYSSTRTLLKAAAAKLRPGSVLVFDEYLNYPGWEQDEFRAFKEFCAAFTVTYRYEGLVTSHQQVCVVIEAIGQS